MRKKFFNTVILYIGLYLSFIFINFCFFFKAIYFNSNRIVLEQNSSFKNVQLNNELYIFHKPFSLKQNKLYIKKRIIFVLILHD
jgi:hypothetical protein